MSSIPRRALPCMLLVALLGGCVPMPLPNLTTPLPSHWRNQPSAPTTAKPENLQSWWYSFDDTRLNDLVKQSLHSNLNVAQAVEHLRAADTLYVHANAPFKPSLGFRTYHPVDPSARAAFFVIGFQSLLPFGWFGRRQGNLREARGHVAMAGAGLREARVSLIAGVVHDWIDLCAAQQRLQLLTHILATRRKIVRMEAVRVHLRLNAPDKLAQARAAQAEAEAALSGPRQEQNAAAQHMALLLGRTEPETAWLSPHSLPVLRKQNLTAIPATLLRTRPQIARARAAVLHAAGALGIAHANTLPDIGLGGSIIWSTHTFTHRGEPSNAIASFGPTINIPLLDWGLRKAREHAKNHQLKASVLAYRQAVLEGVAAVETALGDLAQQRHREQASTRAWQALARMDTHEATRKRLGLIGDIAYARGVIARDQAKLKVIDARSARDMAYVALYKALGGAPDPRDVTALGSAKDKVAG